ncbi:hypothetical protein [Streptomyces sp. NPDC056987]
MNRPKGSGDDAWEECVHRATAAMAVGRHAVNENCWDDVAIRDIIAVVLYSLHLREEKPVATVEWKSVLWHLRDDGRVSTLVRDVLPGANCNLGQGGENDDPVMQRWR